MRFNIRKGNFSSGIHFGLHSGRVSQTYKVRFDSSCLYDDINWERDWNKLVGWSYSNLPYYYDKEQKWQAPHHDNSIRIVWRANKAISKIELAGYYYQDGVRYVTDVFAVLDVDKDYTLGIFYKEDKHQVDAVDQDANQYRLLFTCTQKEDGYIATKSIALIKPFSVKASYKLYPYFGGSDPAPHNMFLDSTET